MNSLTIVNGSHNDLVEHDSFQEIHHFVDDQPLNKRRFNRDVRFVNPISDYSPFNTIQKIYGMDGINGVESHLKSALDKPSETTMNNFGYQLLQHGKTKDAISIFTLNVSHYPDSWNVYDSLAEGYFRLESMEESKRFYQKSL